jgi:hypothetical protein
MAGAVVQRPKPKGAVSHVIRRRLKTGGVTHRAGNPDESQIAGLIILIRRAGKVERPARDRRDHRPGIFQAAVNPEFHGVARAVQRDRDMMPRAVENVDGTGLVQLSDDVAEETDFAVEEPDEPSTARPVVGGDDSRVAFRRR